MQACIRQTKGQGEYEFYMSDIPADRWGDPVQGRVSSPNRAYVLWLFDADCKSYKAVVVPAGGEKTFRGYVGQVWEYVVASADQPVGSCDCGVFNPSNHGVDWKFNDNAHLTFFTE